MFTNVIMRQRRITEAGTQQLLLDVYSIKTILLQLHRCGPITLPSHQLLFTRVNFESCPWFVLQQNWPGFSCTQRRRPKYARPAYVYEVCEWACESGSLFGASVHRSSPGEETLFNSV